MSQMSEFLRVPCNDITLPMDTWVSSVMDLPVSEEYGQTKVFFVTF